MSLKLKKYMLLILSSVFLYNYIIKFETDQFLLKGIAEHIPFVIEGLAILFGYCVQII